MRILSAMFWRIIALVAVSLIWGTTFVVVKETLESMPASLLVALRFGFSLLFVLWVRPSRKTLWAGIIFGLLTWFGYVSQTIGLVYTTASKAAFITGLSVIFTPIFSSIYFKKRLAWRIYLAAAVALLGLAFLSFSGVGDGAGINIGDIWVLACALSYAITIIYIGEITEKHSVLQLLSIQFYPMVILSFIWAAPHLHLIPSLPWQSYLAVLYLALVATIITGLLHLWGQQKVSASLTALIFILEPVFAAIFAAFFLQEMLGFWGYVGAGFIFGAMLLSEWQGGRMESD